MSTNSANEEGEYRQQSQNATCAECRRLRLQCDKRIPCKSCVRRGYPELCPNGTKTTGDGTKVVLAATKELHETVKGLRDRIRALETALNDLHVDRTGRTHPMLASAHFDLGADEDSEPPVIENTTEQVNPMQKIALVRGRDGAHRIAAAYGRTWVAYSFEEPGKLSSAPDAMEHAQVHYPGIQLRRHPFAPVMPIPFSTLQTMQQRIPADDVLNALLGVFLGSFGSTGFAPVFTEAYIRNVVVPNARAPLGGPLTAAALGTLFAILGIGALFAINHTEAPEVESYGDLSVAALVGMDLLSSPSLEVIEALWLRCNLEFLRQDQLEERARIGANLAASMCFALGLHRESTTFGLRPEVIERRRTVFWMVFRIDVWESLCTGRPGVLTFATEFIDTKLPAGTGQSPDLEASHSIINFAIVVEMIAKATLSLKSPSYDHILKLDHLVRNLKRHGRHITTSTAIPPPEILLLYLHRAFYVRALKEHGEDPSKSEYYYSFNAVLRAVRVTLSWANVVTRQSPGICARFYWIWSIAVTATMIYAVMLEHAPDCEFAVESRAALKSSLELFQLGATYGSGRAKQALTMFNNIRELVEPHLYCEPSDVCTHKGHPDTTYISSSASATVDITTHELPARSTKYPNPTRTLPPRADQYSVGPSKQLAVRRIHRSRDGSQSQRPRKAINVMHDQSLAAGERQPQHSRDRLQSDSANPPVNEAPSFSDPWSLWKGHGWGGMDQSPMELTVPDGLESLGNFNPVVAENWLTSLGIADAGCTGGLNGEWAASSQHL